MWILQKPDTTKAFGKDIEELVRHCRNLDDSDKLKLKKLYRQYDTKGYATVTELNPLDANKDIIKIQYEVKFQPQQPLRYIRDELFFNVSQCPYCGINQINPPQQLDHYMAKSHYGQLACCRLNLVPICGVCNNIKSNQPYTNFVHAYYDRYGDVDFLETEITIKNGNIGFIMRINRSVISDQDLARRTEFQFNQMSQEGRFHKEGVKYIKDFIEGLSCSTDQSLKSVLNSTYDHNLKWYGRNHWKTSIIRGLINSTGFNIQVVDSIRKTIIIRQVNGIGA